MDTVFVLTAQTSTNELRRFGAIWAHGVESDVTRSKKYVSYLKHQTSTKQTKPAPFYEVPNHRGLLRCFIKASILLLNRFTTCFCPLHTTKLLLCRNPTVILFHFTRTWYISWDHNHRKKKFRLISWIRDRRSTQCELSQSFRVLTMEFVSRQRKAVCMPSQTRCCRGYREAKRG